MILDKTKQIFRYLRNNPQISLSIILILLIGGIYLRTIANFQIPIGDAGEFASVGYGFGLAHPPGYIVYSGLIFVFTHLIPFGSIFFKAGLTSLITQLLSSLIFFLLSFQLATFIQKNKTKGIIDEWILAIFCFAGSIILSLSFSYWLYANVPEVFGLNDLYVILICFSILNFYYSQGKKWFLIPVIACIYGLGILHLQTIILTFPPVFSLFIYTIFKFNKQKETLRYTLFVIIGFLSTFLFSIALLIISNSLQHNPSWTFTSTLSGLIAFITRARYSASSSALGSYLGSGNGMNYFSSLIGYSQSIMNDFSFFPLILTIPGVIFIWKKNRMILSFFLSLFILCGPLFVMYAGYPDSSNQSLIVNAFVQIATIQRQFIMSDIFIALFILFGLIGLYEAIIRLLVDNDDEFTSFAKTRSGQSFMTTVVLSIVLIGLLFITNFSSANLHNMSMMQTYAKDSLNDAKKNSVVICFSDITCDSYIYEQTILGTRPDLIIVPFYYSIKQKYLDSLKNLQGFNYSFNPNNIEDIVSWSYLHGKNVYVADVSGDYIKYLGLEGNAFFLVPDEYLHQLARTVPSTEKNYSYLMAKNMTKYVDSNGGMTDKNTYMLTFYGFIPRSIGLNSYLYWEEGYRELALNTLKSQYNINSEIIPESQYMQTRTYYEDTASPYKSGDKIKDASYFISKAKTESDQNIAYQSAIYASLIDPTNIESHLLAASIIRKENPELSKIEYMSVLKLDKNNTTALNALKDF